MTDTPITMFGSHLSIAGGLENALIEAKSMGMDCVQIFTKNQRQWNVAPLKKHQIERWNHYMACTNLGCTISHDSYLINLAGPDRDNRRKSLKLFRDELVRCRLLGIPFLVAHPGSHMGKGEAEGIKRIAESLNTVHDALPDLNVITCLETTAGQGTSLGYRFEHLAQIIQQVESKHRLGVCLDTAHLLAAGYNLTSAAGMRHTLRECKTIIGLDRVKVLHMNDSKTPRGSCVDRHEHIGRGHIAMDAFAVLINLPQFRYLPKILETPKGKTAAGRPWDKINLAKLRKLARHKRQSKRD